MNVYCERRGSGGGCVNYTACIWFIVAGGADRLVPRMDIYIVSNLVQKGALWPLQPAVYDILRNDGLHERTGHNIWIHIKYIRQCVWGV